MLLPKFASQNSNPFKKETVLRPRVLWSFPFAFVHFNFCYVYKYNNARCKMHLPKTRLCMFAVTLYQYEATAIVPSLDIGIWVKCWQSRVSLLHINAQRLQRETRRYRACQVGIGDQIHSESQTPLQLKMSRFNCNSWLLLSYWIVHTRHSKRSSTFHHSATGQRRLEANLD